MSTAKARNLEPIPTTKEGRRIIPLGPRVIVRRTQAEAKIGSIHVPDSAKEKPSEGVVVALGPGVRLENGTIVPPAVKVGDVVMWGRFGGNEIKVDGEEHFSIHQDEILCIVDTAKFC